MANIKSVEGISLRRLRYMLKVSQEDADAGHLDITQYSHFARMLSLDATHPALEGITPEAREEMRVWVQQMGTGIIQRMIEEIALAPEELRGVSTLVALHAILSVLSACINDYTTARVYKSLMEEQVYAVDKQCQSLLHVRGIYTMGQMIGLTDKELKEWQEVEFTTFKESLAEVIRRKEMRRP